MTLGGSTTGFNMVVLNVTGVPEFDYFFSIVFWVGFVAQVVSLPLKLFRGVL